MLSEMIMAEIGEKVSVACRAKNPMEPNGEKPRCQGRQAVLLNKSKDTSHGLGGIAGQGSSLTLKCLDCNRVFVISS